MSLSRQIFSNTAVQIIAKAAIALLSVVTIKMITMHFGQSQYGEYTYIYEYLGIFAIMADMGLYTIAVREMSVWKTAKDKVLGNILSMRIVLSVFAMSAAVLYAYFFQDLKDYVFHGIAIAAMAIFLSFMTGTVTPVLQVNMKMKFAALGLFIGKVLSTGYLLLAIFSGWSFEHLLVAGVFGNIFAFMLTYGFARRYQTNIMPKIDVGYWKQVIKTALPFGLALILSTLYFKIDTVMLFHMRTEAEVGIYGVPMRVLEIMNIIPIIFLNTVLPTITALATSDHTRLRHIMQKVWDVLIFLSFAIVGGGIAVSHGIILFVSSSEFLESIWPLRVLLFAMMGSFLNQVFAFHLIAFGRQAHMLYVNAAALTFNIVSNAVFIPIYGYKAAALTSVISEFIVLSLLALVLSRYFAYKLHFVSTAKTFVLASIMTLSTYALYTSMVADMHYAVALMLSIVFGAGVYFAGAYIFGIVKKEYIYELLLKKEDE